VTLGAVALMVGACTASPQPPLKGTDAGRDGGPVIVDGGTRDAGVPDAGPPDAGRDAGTDAGADGGVACLTGAADALLACLNQGTSPDDCVDLYTAPLCDSDGDGVGDDLEHAMARAYAPVFAFNAGGCGGNAETDWAANVNHFVTHAQLFYRPSDGGTDVLVDPAPTLTGLPRESLWVDGRERFADDPALGSGSEYFLCLKDTTGSSGVRVESKEAMLALPDGVDVTTLVQPANGALANSDHLMVSYQLFFAYNEFSTLDNHEGDWEGVIAFVNRMTGGVDAAYFGRHGTTDSTSFVDTATYPVRDPATPVPACDTNVDHSDPAIHGLRFQDFGGLRHHLVAFVSTGSHAMYDYPANTFVINNLFRDTHNGDGPWLDLARAELSSGGTAQAVKVVWRNPGQLGKVTQAWAEYRGQWGCQDEAIANSWPGPWGNVKYPRPELTRAWGSPPVAP
jgi:hypothetical protein